MKTSVSLAVLSIAIGGAAALPACSTLDNFSMHPYGTGGGGRSSDASAAHPEGGPAAAPTVVNAQRIASGLDFPTAIDFYEGLLVVTEAGHLPDLTPKVKTIDASGRVATLLSASDLPAGTLLGPLTDVAFHDDFLWIAHRQRGANGWAVGAISVFKPEDPVGSFRTVLTNLPSAGDHYTSEIVFDQNGRAYFSQGSATNSDVVGPDNSWLREAPGFHDYPPVDIRLNDSSFATPNPLSDTPNATALTAPYQPFDSGPVASGTVVRAPSFAAPRDGIVAGNGAVYSFEAMNPATCDPTGSIRLEAWGLRDPYGMAFDPQNPDKLYTSNNGADIRMTTNAGRAQLTGSRPIANDLDDMFVVPVGGNAEFFGFPDFLHREDTRRAVPIEDPMFCNTVEAEIPCPSAILDESFRRTLAIEPAFTEIELHSSANKFDFAPDAAALGNDIFLAETGAFVGATGARVFHGYKVVRIDRTTGNASDYFVNPGTVPAELFDPSHLNKPIDVKFHDASMYVVDFGVFEPGLGISQPGTGKVYLVAARGGPATEAGAAPEGADAGAPADAAVATEDAAAPPAPQPAPSVTVAIPSGAMTLGTTAYGTNPRVVPAGSTVTWVNNDSVPHTATSDSGVFDSGTLSPGGSFSFTFTTPGTFPYHCTIHGAASMSGTIEVTGAP